MESKIMQSVFQEIEAGDNLSLLKNGGISVKMESYAELCFTIKSLLRLSGKALFEQGGNVESETKIDIYNVLTLVGEMLPVSEFELLDRLVDHF